MTDWARLRADVARESLTIAAGSTAAVVCPKCIGGTTGERSMSVTHAINGAMFLCHRSSCGFRGFVGMDGDGVSRDMPRKSEARPFDRETYRLDQYQRAVLLGDYAGFSTDELATHMSVNSIATTGGVGGCLVFPCEGFNGDLLGHVTRSLDKVIKTYRATANRDMYSVYRPTTKADRNKLVVVEDCISAMCCASHGYTGIALLGTHLTPEVREAINAQEFSAVRVYLDPDADSKAITIAGQLRGVAVIGERVDPKDNPNLAKVLRLERG